jgi:hypothetical protein
MSELQKRIVERLTALDRSQEAGLASDTREKLMTAAIGLFYTLGGDADEPKDICLRAAVTKQQRGRYTNDEPSDGSAGSAVLRVQHLAARPDDHLLRAIERSVDLYDQSL